MMKITAKSWSAKKKKKRKKYFHELDNTLVIKKGNPPVRYHSQQQ